MDFSEGFLLEEEFSPNCKTPYLHVRMATDLSTHEKVVVKYMKIQDVHFDKICYSLLTQEIYIHSQLQHPSIIEVVDFAEEGVLYESVNEDEDPLEIKAIYLATKFAEYGEIFDYVSKTGPFSEKVAKRLFLQLLDGLEYIHSQGFCHLDIKLENLVLDSEFNLKIIDFGYACPLEEPFQGCGTRGFKSPERVFDLPFSGDKSDIFSAGVILFIFLLASPPFFTADFRNDKYYALIFFGKATKYFRIFDNHKRLSSDFKSLVFDILKPETKRKSMIEIKSSEFVLAPSASDEEYFSEFQYKKSKL